MKDFAANDFETANGQRSGICSVGVAIVRNGQITDIYRPIRPKPNYCPKCMA
jgi:DNA polymerase-3 subunit epsilon